MVYNRKEWVDCACPRWDMWEEWVVCACPKQDIRGVRYGESMERRF